MNIHEYKLIKTCGACPEQYDVYKDDKIVGYLRLRHGYFRAVTELQSTQTVYEAWPAGDGTFDEDEREFHLTEAIKKIKEKHCEEN